jgi:hypothetical protein
LVCFCVNQTKQCFSNLEIETTVTANLWRTLIEHEYEFDSQSETINQTKHLFVFDQRMINITIDQNQNQNNTNIDRKYNQFRIISLEDNASLACSVFDVFADSVFTEQEQEQEQEQNNNNSNSNTEEKQQASNEESNNSNSSISNANTTNFCFSELGMNKVCMRMNKIDLIGVHASSIDMVSNTIPNTNTNQLKPKKRIDYH